MRYFLIMLTVCCAFDANDAKAEARQLTTLSGVFSSQQAGRGASSYEQHCRRCHMPTYFQQGYFYKWRGMSLKDFVGFVRTQMPKDKPNSLSRRAYYDIAAYLLRINRLPVADQELTHRNAVDVIIELPYK